MSFVKFKKGIGWIEPCMHLTISAVGGKSI